MRFLILMALAVLLVAAAPEAAASCTTPSDPGTSGCKPVCSPGEYLAYAVCIGDEYKP